MKRSFSFPGSYAVYERSSKNLDVFGLGFIMRSGRALVYPIYKSQYERGDGLESDDPGETARYRDHVIYWGKDLGRTIDYLETRKDLKSGQVGVLRIEHRGIFGKYSSSGGKPDQSRGAFGGRIRFLEEDA